MTYRTDPPDALRIVPLNSLTAIYHRCSGQTHVVAEPVPEILAALAEGEADLPALLARLGLNADATEVLTSRLDELVASGLVTQT